MSLNIYTRERDIPKSVPFILANDAVFSGRLGDDALTRRILKEIDGAERLDEQLIRGKAGNLTSADHISTGAKTLLNIYTQPQRCFTVAECGNNALCMLPLITAGHVFWQVPVALCDHDIPCDIMYRHRRFKSFWSFLNFCRINGVH